VVTRQETTYLQREAVQTTGASSDPPALTAVDIANGSYGAFPSDYEKIVKNDLEPHLIDPESVRYRSISTPRKHWEWWNSMRAYMYGYSVCVSYNAKNRMGGYTGFTTDVYFIRNGIVMLKMVENDPHSAYPRGRDFTNACG
jgi:hypothetical protein